MKYKLEFKFPQEAIMIIVLFGSAYFFIKFIITGWNIDKTFFQYNQYMEYLPALIIIYLISSSISMRKI